MFNFKPNVFYCYTAASSNTKITLTSLVVFDSDSSRMLMALFNRIVTESDFNQALVYIGNCNFVLSNNILSWSGNPYDQSNYGPIFQLNVLGEKYKYFALV